MANCLIIGANRGIGLALCQQHLALGDSVTAVCRRSSSDLDASDAQVVVDVDITSSADLAGLASSLGGHEFQILYVVAGILEGMPFDNLDFESIERQFLVNALGPLRAVSALAHLLTDAGKIGLLTSRMGSVTDNTSGGQYGYRMSKAALNIAGKSLAHDLKDRGISVALLHPGYVRTDMTGGSGLIDTDESASGLIRCMQNTTLENSGSFWHTNGEELPW